MTRKIIDTRPAEVGGGRIVRIVCGAPHPSGDDARICTRAPHATGEGHINRDGNRWNSSSCSGHRPGEPCIG